MNVIRSGLDPWPVTTRLAVLRKGWRHSVARRLAAARSDEVWVVFWVWSWIAQLQKSMGGMWPGSSGE
jgi:hypothetical protein